MYGQPVYKLLGGAVRDRVRIYARSDLGLATHVDELKAALREGFNAFKFSPGDIQRPFGEEKQVDIALALAEELRSSAGADCEFMIDCAGLFTLAAAHRLVQGLRPHKLLFVEEPVNMDTPGALVALRRAFPDVRIAAGERVVTRWGFREWLETGAVDVIQADISHCGGISELMRIAACAEVYNVQVAPHNPYGPVAMAANLHACAAMPNFLILEHCRLRPWFEEAQVFGPRIEGGCLHLDERPGLGVEVDWEFIKKHPYYPIPTRLQFGPDGGLIAQ